MEVLVLIIVHLVLVAVAVARYSYEPALSTLVPDVGYCYTCHMLHGPSICLPAHQSICLGGGQTYVSPSSHVLDGGRYWHHLGNVFGWFILSRDIDCRCHYCIECWLGAELYKLRYVKVIQNGLREGKFKIKDVSISHVLLLCLTFTEMYLWCLWTELTQFSALVATCSVTGWQQNEALNVTDGISTALPDICIVYRLHLECGRLINLYDWMQVVLLTLHCSFHQFNSVDYIGSFQQVLS